MRLPGFNDYRMPSTWEKPVTGHNLTNGSTEQSIKGFLGGFIRFPGSLHSFLRVSLPQVPTSIPSVPLYKSIRAKLGSVLCNYCLISFNCWGFFSQPMSYTLFVKYEIYCWWIKRWWRQSAFTYRDAPSGVLNLTLWKQISIGHYMLRSKWMLGSISWVWAEARRLDPMLDLGVLCYSESVYWSELKIK